MSLILSYSVDIEFGLSNMYLSLATNTLISLYVRLQTKLDIL